LNNLAAAIVDEATADREPGRDPMDATREKDPAAVSLGRRGGLKGGKARAQALSPEDRKRIAQEAARKRWRLKAPES
jgi:hypothetical protein